jgi:hypothetical protein
VTRATVSVFVIWPCSGNMAGGALGSRWRARVGWCLGGGITPEEADADLLRLASLN